MNADKLIANYLGNKDKIDRRSFGESLIKRYFHYQRNSRVLYIFVPQMSGLYGYTTKLRKLMKKKGYSFLEYHFSKNLLSDDFKQVSMNFNEIKMEVIAKITQLKEKYGFEEINLIGMSIGCVSACLIGNNNYSPSAVADMSH